MDSPSMNSVGGGGGGGIDLDKQRDRNRRGERGTRFSDNKDNEDRDRSRERPTGDGSSRRVYVSNIPYEYRWQDLKDLFRRMVGSVSYVELFLDENNKARGCGIVEFKDPENVAKAMEVMHRHNLNGREIVVKEDHGEQRDKYGRIERGGGGGGGGGGGSGGGGSSLDNARNSGRGNQGGRDRDDDRYSSMNSGGNNKNNSLGLNNYDQQDTSYNTYGLSPSFLASLRIQGPLHNKVFVANLDYKVDSKKLKQVFKLAGRVISVDLAIDQEGSSRGFAVVEYDHPVEAVQAISMFDHQMLFDRRMTVRLDRIPEKEKLPEGLGGIGLGLGPNGEPLRNVALNLSSLQNPNNLGINSNSGNNAPVPVAAPPPLSAASMLGQNTSSNLNNLAALNNVVGNLNSLNPLLSLGLSTLAGNSNESNNSALDIAKIVGSGGNASGGNNLGVGNNVTSGSAYSSLGNLGNLNASNRMESNLSNPYANNYNSLQSLNSSNLNSNNSGNNYVSAQRDYDLNSAARSYSQQSSDDFVRLNTSQSFNSSQLGNGTGANQQSNQRSISDTILIRNLPPNCTWQTLRDKFREIGEVKFAEIRGQDCGVVRFSKERDAELAIKLKDGSRFEGRTVDVTFF